MYETIADPTEICCDRILALAGAIKSTKPVDISQSERIICLLENISGAYYGLRLFNGLRKEIQRIISKIINIDNEPLNVAVIGEFSAGKSSLINALLGGNAFLPTNISETTALVSKLEYALYPSLTVHYKNGASEQIEIESYKNLVDEKQHSDIRAYVEYVTAYFNYKPLNKITIFDTPGLNSKIVDHERTTLHYINSVEVVFWIFKANKPVSGTEMEYIHKIKDRGCKIYGIINGIDKINGFHRNKERWESEMKRVLDMFKQRCGSYTEKIIPVSAKLGIQGMKESNNEILEKSNIKSLKMVIETELIQKTEKFKQLYLRKMVSLFTNLDNATSSCLNEMMHDSIKAVSETLDFIYLKEEELETALIELKTRKKSKSHVAPWELI